MALGTSPQPDRFFDGGTDDEPPERGLRPRIVLERVPGAAPGTGSTDGAASGSTDRFRMLRRIGYDDHRLGPILVPDDLDRATTDLASVPSLFTWLVPKSGRHLPAALVHDGLVGGGGGAGTGEPQYRADAGTIDRAEADRVFRDAMRDGGTGLIRRWLVWSAVTLATVHVGVREWSALRRWRYRIPVYATLLVVAVLGVLATLDLLDLAPSVVGVPWMEDRAAGGVPGGFWPGGFWPSGFWGEVAGGAAGALVVPLLLALTWGRFAVAGAVIGVAMAFLLHVTVVVAALTLGYQALEWATARWPRAVLTAATVLVGAGALVLVVELAW